MPRALEFITAICSLALLAGCGTSGSSTSANPESAGPTSAAPKTSANNSVASTKEPPMATWSTSRHQPRSTEDLPDEVPGFQLHLMYVLPSDGIDKHLDTDGTLGRFASQAQRWFTQRAHGKRLRFDTLRGSPEVSFVRSTLTDAELDGSPEQIIGLVHSAGYNAPNKIYAVFYEGTDGGRNQCGSSGDVSIIFLGMFDLDQCRGLDPGLTMLHEVLHAMGAVPECAPNKYPESPTHVRDDATDIMFAGPGRALVPTALDSGRDDYFSHDDPSCLDLAESPFLYPAEGAPFSYPRWPRFSSPLGIAFDPSGIIYVADTFHHRIQAFTTQGAFLRSWGSEGIEKGQFRQVRDVDIGPNGNVYVVDEGNHRVQRFTPTGVALGMWGGHGTGPGFFASPGGIAVGPDGSVYVADTRNHRIQSFNPDGSYRDSWGSRGTGVGEFESPQGISVSPDGKVYVADTGNHRIQRFTAAGKFRDVIQPAGLEFPFDVAVDTTGRLYIPDSTGARVLRVGHDGRLQAKWISTELGGRTFNRPVALAVAQDGAIFLTDSGDNRVRIIRNVA